MTFKSIPVSLKSQVACAWILKGDGNKCVACVFCCHFPSEGLQEPSKH